MPRRRSIGLTEVGVTEKFIQLVKDQPHIYDVFSPNHTNPVITGQTWDSIAEELNIPGVSGMDVRVRWRSLRDTYVKRKRELAKYKQFGGMRAPAPWKFMDNMNFLDPFIRIVSYDSSLMAEDSEQNVSQNEGSTHESERNSDREDDISPGIRLNNLVSRKRTTVVSPHVSQEKRKRHRSSDFESDYLDLAKFQSSLLKQQSKERRSRTAIDSFFESCALRAKELPKSKQSWLLMQVSMLLFTAENSDDDSLPLHMMCHKPQGVATQKNVAPAGVAVPSGGVPDRALTVENEEQTPAAENNASEDTNVNLADLIVITER